MPDNNVERGLFIAIEGIDGCGKTTQVERILSRLNTFGATARAVHDPGTNPSGMAIRKVLLDKDIPLHPQQQVLLYTAARWATAETVATFLNKGINVVADRWVLSTFVYQGRMGQVGKAKVADLHKKFINIDPDVYVVLDVPPEVAQDRLRQDEMSKDRFESRDNRWWSGLRDAYLVFAQELGVQIVDGTGTPEKVQERIIAACKASPMWPKSLAKF